MADLLEPDKFALSSTGARRLQSWLTRHLQSFFYTLGLLSRAPLASTLTAAVIGERWQVGGTVLEVSEPRLPCWRLNLRMTAPRLVQRFTAAGRPGG